MNAGGPGSEPQVVVVGGGQAGLATGHHLDRAGVPFTILEAGDRVGGSWLDRWDSLRLFTPARFDGLPGRPFPGNPNHYPAGTEVAAYLQDYAAARALPVELGARVRSVERNGEWLRVRTDGNAWRAGAVVVATGAFQQPRTPGFATDLDGDVHQVHTARYRNPGEIPSGRVLVVGAGNSGLQIAAELAATHEVHLAVGSKQMPLPRRVLGRDIFWWLDRLGFTRAPLERMPRWLAGDGNVLVGQTVPGTARRTGLTLHPRATAAAGDTVLFEGGSRLSVRTVVWATGYISDFSWLPDAATHSDGTPAHRRGVTAVPGLYFVGLENQWTSASALLGWVQRDAAFVAGESARRIAEVRRSHDDREVGGQAGST